MGEIAQAERVAQRPPLEKPVLPTPRSCQSPALATLVFPRLSVTVHGSGDNGRCDTRGAPMNARPDTTRPGPAGVGSQHRCMGRETSSFSRRHTRVLCRCSNRHIQDMRCRATPQPRAASSSAGVDDEQDVEELAALAGVPLAPAPFMEDDNRVLGCSLGGSAGPRHGSSKCGADAELRRVGPPGWVCSPVQRRGRKWGPPRIGRGRCARPVDGRGARQGCPVGPHGGVHPGLEGVQVLSTSVRRCTKLDDAGDANYF